MQEQPSRDPLHTTLNTIESLSIQQQSDPPSPTEVRIVTKLEESDNLAKKKAKFGEKPREQPEFLSKYKKKNPQSRQIPLDVINGPNIILKKSAEARPNKTLDNQGKKQGTKLLQIFETNAYSGDKMEQSSHLADSEKELSPKLSHISSL